ncbi:hypothetical protein R1flu_018784 [Riccia fluitans]|uniref:RING-type domain-containing protein n=1 Tax=Riccia fluitans TaxID=41844 RepID=A0ABD1ZGU2_9MARC
MKERARVCARWLESLLTGCYPIVTFSGKVDVSGPGQDDGVKSLMEESHSHQQMEDSVECGCCFELCFFHSMVQVRKCFSDSAWLTYEQRRAEDAVAKANLGGLDEEDCLRTEVEERMTQALIRVCLFCSAELLKNEGCNKIVCRCGQKMCYICREAIKDYSHFCPHIRSRRDLKEPCKECSLCCLWTKDDEREVVEAAKSAALEKLASNYPDVMKRKIGPSGQSKQEKSKQESKRSRAVPS